MSNYFLGTLTPSPIVRGSSGDTFGTHHSVLGVGGFMEVKTTAERNALPIDTTNGMHYDGISSGQRRLGMLVFVYEDLTIYQLEPPVAYSVWNTYNTSQKQAALADNNNWTEFLSVSGQTYSGERIWSKYIQLTHGFVPGDVVSFSGVTNEFIKSSSTNALITEPLGIVSEVDSNDIFNLTYSGVISTFGMTDDTNSALIGGELYYLSPTLGKLTLTEPTSLSDMSKPMLATLTDGEYGIVLQYNGRKIYQDGLSYDVFTGYTASTQTFLNAAVTGGTNIGLFNGMTGVQSLDIDTGYVPNDGIYSSIYDYYYRDNTGVIRIGASPIDGYKRQGYKRTTLPVKSWLWNEYVGGGNQIGWIMVDGDITTNIGSFLTGINYAGLPFTGVTWTAPYYNNTVDVFITVSGSVLTGSTYTNQGPVYSMKIGHDLGFRTLRTKNTSISITHDDNFVYLSGTSQTLSASNFTNGLTYSGGVAKLGGLLTENTEIDGDNLNNIRFSNMTGFRIDSPLTLITDTSPIPMGIRYDDDYSSTYVNRSLVDKEYVDNKAWSGGGSGTTTASNGLTKVINNIRLGGDLCLNTTINGLDIHSLSLHRLCALSICSESGIYRDTSGTPNGLVYYADYSASYVNRSLVDKGYVTSQLNTISANNGLSILNKNITWGGSLTGTTTIHGGGIYGVDFKCLSSVKICTAGGVFADTSASPTGLVYYDDYSATYVDRSLVDKAYVIRANGLRNTTGTTASTYSIQDGDYFIGVKTSAIGFFGGYNVFLPTIPINGSEHVVTDIGGNSGLGAATRIHIWGAGGYQILNWSEAVIDTDYGSITFLFNGIFWSVVGFTSAPSYA